MVKAFLEDVKQFFTNKIFCFVVCLAAIGSYGFKISHISIGIDDTCVPLYFEDGLAPAVGRWTLFLINKIFHISEFTPWITDLVGVLFLIVSSALWCVLLWRVFGNRVSDIGYVFFASLFITCPLISEVYVYYLHNGIGLGYGLTAVALLYVQDILKNNYQWRKCCIDVLNAAIFLTIALGCYESFMMVYIMGVVLLFIAMGMIYEKGYGSKIWKWGVFAVIPVILAMLLRSIMINLVCAVFQVSIPENFNVGLRSLSLFSGSASELFMYVKRYWVKFFLNFFAYLPITVLVFGIGTLFVLCVIHGIKKKDVCLPLAAIALPILPVLLIFIEGKESYYRASQYVPLVGAFAVFLLVWKGQQILPVWGKRVGIFALTALLWNQCEEMNRMFYFDYLKYEYFKDVVTKVAYDLGNGYDLSKPVIFEGECSVPRYIVENVSLRFDSTEYRIIKKIGDLVDEHLIEKYNMSDGTGYLYVETPIFSTLQWGITAFDDTSREIGNFMSMHGYEVIIETDLMKIKQAEELSVDMRRFPQEGYIREYEEYIIINL